MSSLPALLKAFGGLTVVALSFAATLWIMNSWTSFQTSKPGIIHVLQATYGGNCDGTKSNLTGQLFVVKPGNATADASKICDGKSHCSYDIDAVTLGDPAGGCAKDFTLTWRCDADATINRRVVPPEANLKGTVIACPAE